MKKLTLTTIVIAIIAIISNINTLKGQSLSLSTFINEINYLASNPTGRGLEIAGQAGTNLAGWEIVGYTAQGTVAFIEHIENGVIPNNQNGYGTIWYDVDQAGDTGGVALVNPSGSTVQFLSYGAAILISAIEGAANGLASEYIGLQLFPEQTLQLTGTGLSYLDFVWGLPGSSTPDAVNTNQLFPGAAFAQQQQTQTTLGVQNESTLDIGEVPSAKQTQIRLFPNPVVHLLQVTSEDKAIRSIQVIGANGTAIEVPIYRIGSYEIDVQSLPAGQYWLRLETANGLETKAFIKK